MSGHRTFLINVLLSIVCSAVITMITTHISFSLKRNEMEQELKHYVIRRGSIALNGISLTVAEKFENSLRVCIIPETLARTNLRNWVPGTIVNVEVDMLGKYIENYLKERDLAK